MPSFFEHAIKSYEIAIVQLEERLNEIVPPKHGVNLTQSVLEYITRGNLLVVGMCGLVEARLFSYAKDNQGDIPLADVKGQGISRLKLYLSRRKLLDFGALSAWSDFKHVYKIRNAIVHSHGGFGLDADLSEAKESIGKLGYEDMIEGNHIRARPTYLIQILAIVAKLLDEVEEQIPEQPDTG